MSDQVSHPNRTTSNIMMCGRLNEVMFLLILFL
jgi:hypothetical protein